ncbi:hypothetical protein HNQ88_003743 [Aureibacter tunicatorum]|uniref:Uncharacterized protein n=1 Tax=Aureibacter tunicatorum TaxID=866807 RepID=A0AAE3XQE2_9BACT|nr:hypothetical protein [Aureibacter tunicatorum]BDD07000.1 hypothetical protein AUTU_44830 [Aureibacter tunicatorum]
MKIPLKANSKKDPLVNENKEGVAKTPPIIDGIVQRKVGFELETNWFISKNLGVDDEGKPKLDGLKKRDRIGPDIYENFYIEADQAGVNFLEHRSASSIEFVVSPPFEESPDELPRLARVMDQVFAVTEKFRQKMLLHRKPSDLFPELLVPNSFPLSEVTGRACDAEYLIEPDQSKVTGGIQVTTALDMGKFGLMESLCSKEDDLPIFFKQFAHYMSERINLVHDREHLSPELQGLMGVLAAYIEIGSYPPDILNPQRFPDTKDAGLNLFSYALPYPKKLGDNIMLRTDAATALETIPKEELSRLRANPHFWKRMMMMSSGLMPDFMDRPLFETGMMESFVNEKGKADEKWVPISPLKRSEWLERMLFGQDLLADIEEAPCINKWKGLLEPIGPVSEQKLAPVFEIRHFQGRSIDAKDWKKTVLSIFRFILKYHGHDIA